MSVQEDTNLQPLSKFPVEAVCITLAHALFELLVLYLLVLDWILAGGAVAVDALLVGIEAAYAIYLAIEL